MNACTIYGKKIDRSLLSTATKVLQGWSVDIGGTVADWSSATFRHPSGTEFTLNSMPFEEPGDEFNKLLQGTYAYFRSREDLPTKERKAIKSFLDGVEWIVGVVTNDDLSRMPLWECVNALALRVDGRIFDGSDMIVPSSSARG